MLEDVVWMSGICSVVEEGLEKLEGADDWSARVMFMNDHVVVIVVELVVVWPL